MRLQKCGMSGRVLRASVASRSSASACRGRCASNQWPSTENSQAARMCAHLQLTCSLLQGAAHVWRQGRSPCAARCCDGAEDKQCTAWFVRRQVTTG